MSLLLVILSVALAAATVTALIAPGISTRRNSETFEKLARVKEAIARYTEDHAGDPPVSLDLLLNDDGIPCELDNDPSNDTYLSLVGWCGPYVDQVFLDHPLDFETDGWGNVFAYDSTSGKPSSCGPDGSCGNGDDLE